MKKHDRENTSKNKKSEKKEKTVLAPASEETAAEENSSEEMPIEESSADKVVEEASEEVPSETVAEEANEAVSEEKASEEESSEEIASEEESSADEVVEEASEEKTNEEASSEKASERTSEDTSEDTEKAAASEKSSTDEENEESPELTEEEKEKEAEASAKEKSSIYMFFDTIRFVAIGLLVGILLVVFVVQRNDVYGTSMEPTLHSGDAVFVEMISVYTGNFKRGDIVTIDAKGMDGYTHEENLIKRIVGLPGETIKIADGNVYINGVLLDESAYLPEGTQTYVRAEGMSRGYDEVTLGPDEYYCMGDNRGGSNDSRRMGPFKKSQLEAKVVMRIYPFNKMKFF